MFAFSYFFYTSSNRFVIFPFIGVKKDGKMSPEEGGRKGGAVMRQKEVNEIKDRAVRSARSVLCTSILRMAGLPMKTRGNQVYSICYNCGDGTTVKSDKFSVNTDKNLYHCFGCGCGGGAPKLYSELFKTSYMDACLHLAYQNGDVTKEEVERVTGSSDALNKLRADEGAFLKREEKDADEVEQKADVETIDLVYRHMLKLPEFALSTTGRHYLATTRKLSDAEINEVGFFEYKTPFSVDRLILSIRQEKPAFDYNDLLGVAGFYFRFTNKERTRGVWVFKSPYKDCIGIPLRNAEGKISALQMRYLGPKDTKNKYFYVSSKSVREKNAGFGAGCGSPVAVIYPEKIQNSTFCVGEGFFKMKELSKNGSVCFSVQGVNSFTYVADEVKAVLASENLKKKIVGMGKRTIKFMIVYDADMYRKIQVLEAGVKTADYLSKKFPDREVSFLIWNPNLGKGFDDMKYYCEEHGIPYLHQLRKISASDFIEKVRVSVEAADSRYLQHNKGLADTKIRQTKEWGDYLYEELYVKRIS